MKIFTKTFLYTLALLVLIAGLANGIIYTLMPTVYTKQKQQNLTAQADQLAQRLGSAKREDIARLMGSFSARGQANIVVTLGEEKYALIVWSGGSESEGSVTTSVTVTSGTASSGTNSVSTKTGTEKDTGNTGSVAVDGSAALEPGGFTARQKQSKHSAVSRWKANLARSSYPQRWLRSKKLWASSCRCCRYPYYYVS